MPLVDVMVNDRVYSIACDEGEEAHLKELTGIVDARVRELAGAVGQVGDQKLMLMAAVLIADEFAELRGRAEGHAKTANELARTRANLDALVADAETRAATAAREAQARAAEAEKRAAKAIEDAEARIAQAHVDAEGRIADAEARATKAASDAHARVNEMREDAEAQIAEAKRDADARIARAAEDAEHRMAQALNGADGKGLDVSAETEELAAMEMDEAAARVERLVERLKAA